MQNTMQIVADENIPLAAEAFGAFGEVARRPGRALSPADVRDADVLLVRSVTRVDRALLAGSRVRFVGSATIGTDHVDEAYLRERGIAFAHAPGSNATSVVEYVLAACCLLAARRGEAMRGRTVGVVGCGNIGGRLAERLPALGARVLRNDPPLEEAAEARGEAHPYVGLDRLLAEADVVTLHVPLVREGPHGTVHLFDEAVLRRMKPGAWLVNTARGPVVDNAALERVLAEGRLGAAVLDVWEGEPEPDPALLGRVDVATPHIAGYSYDGKVAGTRMLYEALVAHLGASPADGPFTGAGEELELATVPPDPALREAAWLHALVRQLYDLEADDARMRALPRRPASEHAAYFGELRRRYPRRRTFGRYEISLDLVPEAYRDAVLNGLRVRGKPVQRP